ncbi:MAG: 3-oxoacid CoA-transferase [Chloroflexi bacterium]|nr:3-oxoacid CoA-transferase [Chloroflexota bacterium]MCY3582491.1 3-oxoacid CoA-transferase [Chloroflexota bacterium]MCY3716117.1 3-oxoacid CoA-transferase [Chloroflexota bacterium]MDE2649232.1 3-oxoacid CoA-transferase [Chloroflexota bacterium]MYC55887.1 3-oxoacid CoA-transferase subunit B [Chloroflexota bacterium]
MKRVPQLTPQTAAKRIPTGAAVMVGGFGMTGTPAHLLHALAETDTRELTYIANNIGEPGLGGGRLLRNGQISKAIGSFFTSNPEAVAAAQSGAIAFELLPQGNLTEAIRAGGAGIGGFYTPTAAGTPLAAGSEIRRINGRDHVFVPGLRADVALLRARRADEAGNLVYHMTEQNFNKAMATAADLVIAEVDEILPLGSLDPNTIHSPGNYVDALVHAPATLAEMGSSAMAQATRTDEKRLQIARRALAELQPGDVVNLGVGIPTLIADMITPAHGIILHTENGLLGVGPAPASGGALDYPVNAGKLPVTALPGASYFDSADSFAMIRGGHIDVAVMGGLQVDAAGNLANWSVPGKALLGVGGAMDLASGARRLIITMTHCDRQGRPKLVPRCSLPLTAKCAVDFLITELAVFAFSAGQMRLVELMPGVELDKLRAKTGTAFAIHPKLR